MIEIKGKITIGRRTSTVEPEDRIYIVVEDSASGCQVVEMDMSLPNFAKTITSQGFIDCNISFNDSGIIGKTREHKTVKVPYDCIYDDNDELIMSHMRQFSESNDLLENGWVPRIDDYKNRHNHSHKSNTRLVLFERWI